MRFPLLVIALLILSLSSGFAFEPDVLLVDDAGSKQLEPFYGPLCLTAQRTYAAWNVSQAGTVPATALDAYATVVWLAGESANPKGIEGGAATLLAYVDKGGRLLLIGDHLGNVLPEVMAKVFGLRIKRFSPIVTELNGRLADVIADGRKLKLSTPGTETADYVKSTHGETTPHPEIVFWTPDEGASRPTAARIEKLGARNNRAAWFGCDLTRAADAARAGDIFTRSIRWITPEPPAKVKFRKMY
ncbi:MAG: hypothetical protein HY303_00205 [Candidatus Wallbacteria bacterium]|nr:hypothetical protein [Candidatus Wallbacteria bacterium]